MDVERRFKAGHQAVVIALRQRIVLVVMAAATLHRQAEHRSRKHVDHLVHDFIAFVDAVLGLAGVILDTTHESRGRQECQRLGRERVGATPINQLAPQVAR